MANDYLKKIIDELFKGKLRYLIYGFIIIICVWFLLPKVSYNFELFNLSFDLIFRIFLSALILFCSFILFFKVQRNKSKLPGIGFYIDSSVIRRSEFRKNLFFITLIERMKKQYNVIIYEKRELNLMLRKNSMISIMKKLNIDIMFEVAERSGKKNNKDIYELKILCTHIKFPFSFYVQGNFINHFCNDLTNSINFCLEISNDDSLNEIDNEVGLFEIAIEYIKSIIISISDNPERAFQILDRLSAILNVTNIDRRNINYIKNNLKYRYIDTYSNTILKILFTDKYYNDALILQKLKQLFKDYGEMLKYYREQNNIDKTTYNSLIRDYHMQEAIILYEDGNINDAIQAIYKCDLTVIPNDGIWFSRAFLLANNSQFAKSAEIYKKLSKRKKIDDALVFDIIDFIEKRYELHEDSIEIKFCLAIVNYYFKDIILAKKYFEELSLLNNDIKVIYHNILKDGEVND